MDCEWNPDEGIKKAQHSMAHSHEGAEPRAVNMGRTSGGAKNRKINF